MRPNQTAANKLFSVAWQELGLDDSRYKTIQSPMKNMFTFTSGGSAFIPPSSPDDQKKPIIYLRIYKSNLYDVSEVLIGDIKKQ